MVKECWLSRMRVKLTEVVRAARPSAVRSRNPGGVGVTALLVTLVLIPLGAMTMLGVSALSTRRTALRYATHIQDSLSHVDALIALREALHNEQAAADARLRGQPLGLTASQASALFGMDGVGSLVDVRNATDRALADYPRTSMPMVAMPTSASPIDRGELQALRDAIDRRELGAEAADARYEALDGQVAAALHTLLDQLTPMVAEIDDGYRVWAALEALDAASDGLGAGAAQASDMTALLLDTRTPVGPTLVGLSTTTALYAQALARFEDLEASGVAGGWTRIEADPDTMRYEQEVESIEADPPAADGIDPGRDTDVGLMILRGGGVREQRLYGLVRSTTAVVAADVGRLVSGATSNYRDCLAWLTGAAVLTIAVALAVAAYISRPIRRLAYLARAVSAGRLDVQCGAASGPREVAVVARAFDDLVSNLRLLEAKSHALATCDFGNPALSEPLPGGLGRSIQSSVQTLSGSIEERDKLQHRLAHQATHDALTGLCNRAAAINALEHSLARVRRTGDALGLLYIDLDDFKRANDTHGHHVGDRILKEVSARMQAVVRGGDLLARLGGDEFVVVAEGIGDASQAAVLAARLMEVVSAPIECDELHFSVGASVGVAVALDSVDDPEQLLARADLALYRAKQGGRANIEIYDKSLQDELRHRTEVEQALTAAIAAGGGGLVLHYQPVIDSGPGQMVELEALIRWQRPGHEIMAPGEFIPVAEASDLIIDLDVWVLRAVASQIAAWSAHPELADVVVAVNISGRHLLSRKLSDHLRSVLAETRIDPQRLIFEITETVLLSDLATAANELNEVRATGVRVAIDDFGTGYTSIAHLQHLPVDMIKIDRSFVNQVDRVRDRSLVAMVTDLSHNIGVDVVAEGVETHTQREVLQVLGCDSLQGFLISEPISPAEILAWIRARSSADAL